MSSARRAQSATAAVRQLEKQREAKTVRKPGKVWTVESWLTHWVESIAPLAVGENTMVGYGVAVRVHLVPGLGAHRLDRLTPEHIERFYAKMQANGSKAGTAHQVHRTFRTALNEAVRRGHLGKNPVSSPKPRRRNEEEIEPYTVEEVRRILRAAEKRRNSARWAVALALGLRQGEALGLQWTDVDLSNGVPVGPQEPPSATLRPRVRRHLRPEGRLLPAAPPHESGDGGNQVARRTASGGAPSPACRPSPSAPGQAGS